MTTPSAIEREDRNANQPASGRFAAGLTETEVERFRQLLRDACGLEVPLPEAWSRASELLSLVEMLLEGEHEAGAPDQPSPEFAFPRS